MKLLDFIKLLFSKKKQEIFFITNGQTILPEKLSLDEEQQVLLKLKEGDVDARTELIEKNLRLVVYTSTKFENTGLNIEDIISVGSIGLIKAVESYNLDKNIKFATYASRCIENEILMYMRKNSKYKSEISLDEPLSTDKDGNELVIADVIGDDENSAQKGIEKGEEKNLLLDALSLLPAREQIIMRLRYGMIEEKELTQKEVADKLNISQSYISRLEKKILSKLKREIEENQKITV